MFARLPRYDIDPHRDLAVTPQKRNHGVSRKRTDARAVFAYVVGENDLVISQGISII
jgi:hypothetical protein